MRTIPSIWTGMYAEESLAGALSILADQGWPAFEVAWEHVEAISVSAERDREIAAALDTASSRGLTLHQVHAYLPADVCRPDEQERRAEIEKVIVHCGIAARLGADVVVVHPGRGDSGTGHEILRRLNIESFRTIADAAEDLGVRIGIENMQRPPYDDPAALAELVSSIGRPCVGLTLDTSHVNASGRGIGSYLSALGRHPGGRLIATHLSDNDGSGDQHRNPGRGTVDWKALIDGLNGMGYPGYLNLEIPGERTEDPDTRSRNSRAALEITRQFLSSVTHRGDGF